MAIITLTTDFGIKDHFIGAIKGAIYSEIPTANVVDISHHISPFNIQECAYILKNAYAHFPKGSIHIIGVDAEHTPENEHIIVYVDGHYFIGANNGILSLITADFTPEKVFSIHLPNAEKSCFATLDVFTKAACHIARGGTLEVIGKPFSALKEVREFIPRLADNGNSIQGSILYIDNYGNGVTNIHKSMFEAYKKGRAFELNIGRTKLSKISQTYSSIIRFDLEPNKRKGPGDVLALFNSAGYIEIALYKSDLNSVGSATTLLGINYMSAVTITFS